MTELVYMAHPVAAPCECAWSYFDGGCGVLGGPVRCNTDRAKRWLRWLIDAAPSVAIIAPWIPYVEILPDQGPGGYRERGLRDCVATSARCHGIVLVGGRISKGMELERDRHGFGSTLDLTSLGAEPPREVPPGLPWPIEYR